MSHSVVMMVTMMVYFIVLLLIAMTFLGGEGVVGDVHRDRVDGDGAGIFCD